MIKQQDTVWVLVRLTDLTKSPDRAWLSRLLGNLMDAFCLEDRLNGRIIGTWISGAGSPSDSSKWTVDEIDEIFRARLNRCRVIDSM